MERATWFSEKKGKRTLGSYAATEIRTPSTRRNHIFTHGAPKGDRTSQTRGCFFVGGLMTGGPKLPPSFEPSTPWSLRRLRSWTSGRKTSFQTGLYTILLRWEAAATATSHLFYRPEGIARTTKGLQCLGNDPWVVRPQREGRHHHRMQRFTRRSSWSSWRAASSPSAAAGMVPTLSPPRCRYTGP